MADQTKWYNELLDAGFKKENIIVIGPGGGPILIDDCEALRRAYNDNSYSHECTKENLEKVFKDLANRADGNDTVVVHSFSHGLNRGGHSMFALDNGKQDLYDYEYAKMLKPIEAGTELYAITACQSGHFAPNLIDAVNSGNEDNVAVIAECRGDQNAQAEWTYSEHLAKEIAKNGIDKNTNFTEMAENADVNYTQQRKYFGGAWNYTKQSPVVVDMNNGGEPIYIETSKSGDQNNYVYDTSKFKGGNAFDWRSPESPEPSRPSRPFRPAGNAVLDPNLVHLPKQIKRRVAA